MCEFIINANGSFSKKSVRKMSDYIEKKGIASFRLISKIEGIEFNSLPQTLLEGLKEISEAYECSFVDRMDKPPYSMNFAKLEGYNGKDWFLIVSYKTPKDEVGSLESGFLFGCSAEQQHSGSPEGTR